MLLSLAVSLTLTAPPAATPAPAPAKQLKVLAWPGYLERGATDKAYDWVTPFEKATGCQVQVETAATSDEMFEKMKKPGFDLVTASGDASVRLIRAKRVRPIELARVKSWSLVDARFANGDWHTVGDQHYGVPYQWGPNVLMYDTRVFKTPPTSWSVLFTEQKLPDGKTNAGRVQAYDGPIAVADAALFLMKTQPDLGIKSPYELSGAQYKAVLALLTAQRKLVQSYWHDTTKQVEDFKKGAFVASSGWGYQVNALKAEKQPVESTVPTEGATGWADTTMLAADATNVACAYEWMNWSLRPEVQAAVAEWFGSLPVTADGCKGQAPNKTDFCKVNGYALFDRIAFWRTPDLRCATQKECAPYTLWEKDYTALKASKP